MLVCDRCGEQNPDQARFCMSCAGALAPTWSVAGRRTVTIVFSDLVGSTVLGESLEPEALREVLDRYFEAMKACLERYGGTVEKYIGDAVMAVFGLPRVHEDDALRATLAASDMRERLVTLNDELEDSWGVRLTSRTGVHTGEVVAGDPSTGLRLVTGDAVNTAARLEQAAPPGEILLGGPTYDLVAHAAAAESIEPIAAKGKSETVTAYLLRSVRQSPAIARRPVGVMVGRERELATLVGAFRIAVGGPTCRVATVVGEPGVGKSRLVAELAELVADEARILSGRCPPYGDGMTYWPLAEAIREAADIDEDRSREEAIERLGDLLRFEESALIVERLATLMGLSPEPFPTDQLSWAVRRTLGHLARERPLVLVIDDVQWAERALIDAIDEITALSEGVAMLVLMIARPELLDGPPMPTGAAWSPPLFLEPLGDREIDTLLRGLLGSDLGSGPIVERVKAAAQGNPLFVEQLVASWADAQADDGSLEGASDALRPVPPTIDALLRARLDALPQASRSVLDRGAVIGQVFFRSAVAALPGPSDEEVPARLGDLRRRRFVRPDVTPFSDDEGWAFVHQLVRDTTYAGILKRVRSALHERFADWLVERTGDRIGEMSAIVAYHLETAFLLRRELGPLDAAAETLAGRAAAALEVAAAQSMSLFDHVGAARLLGRGAALLRADDARRFRLLVRAMDAAMRGGDREEAARLRGGIDAPPPDAASDARLKSIDALILGTGGELSSAEALARLERAEGILRFTGDNEGLLFALRRQASFLGYIGRIDEARAKALEAGTIARDSSRSDLELEALKSVISYAFFDSSDIAPSIELCRSTIREHSDDPRYAWALTGPLAIMVGMRGQFSEARRLLDDLKGIEEEIGMTPFKEAHIAWARGFVEISADDAGAVEREVRPGLEALTLLGDTGGASSLAAMLAWADAMQGALHEATEMAELSRADAEEDDYDAQVGWRRARALVEAQTGALEDAEALIREALSIVEGTEDINSQAETLLDLGRVLQAAGKRDEAAAAFDRANALFIRKGHLAGVTRAEHLKREGWVILAS